MKVNDFKIDESSGVSENKVTSPTQKRRFTLRKKNNEIETKPVEKVATQALSPESTRRSKLLGKLKEVKSKPLKLKKTKAKPKEEIVFKVDTSLPKVTLSFDYKLNKIADLIIFLKDNEAKETKGLFRVPHSKRDLDYLYNKYIIEENDINKADSENKDIEKIDSEDGDKNIDIEGAAGLLKMVYKETNIFEKGIEENLVKTLLLKCEKKKTKIDSNFFQIFIDDLKKNLEKAQLWQVLLLAQFFEMPELIDVVLSKLKENEQNFFNQFINYLYEVSEKSSVNKMTSYNLAQTFGPNLIPESYSDRKDIVDASQKFQYFIFLNDISISFFQKLIDDRKLFSGQSEDTPQAENSLHDENKVKISAQVIESYEPNNVSQAKPEIEQQIPKSPKQSAISIQSSEPRKSNKTSQVEPKAEKNAKPFDKPLSPSVTRTPVSKPNESNKTAQNKPEAEKSVAKPLSPRVARPQVSKPPAPPKTVRERTMAYERANPFPAGIGQTSASKSTVQNKTAVAKEDEQIAKSRDENTATDETNKSCESNTTSRQERKVIANIDESLTEAVQANQSQEPSEISKEEIESTSKSKSQIVPSFSAIKTLGLAGTIGTGVFVAKRGQQIMKFFKLHENPNSKLFSLLSPYFVNAETLPPLDGKNVAFYSLAIGGLAIGVYKTVTTAEKLFNNYPNKTLSKKCAEILEGAFWVSVVAGSGYAAHVYR